ncbi:MAG: sugar transferase [Crocinitomicaceae bacterium]
MYFFFKRAFDIVSSLLVIIFCSPLFIFLSVWIALESRGGVLYKQERVGKNGKSFLLLKFRSMRPNSDRSGQLTVGNDNRVTKVGRFIRKYKLDELPQLFNIIKGEMSVVGPRPEVPKYVNLYNEQQREVLTVLPGLTDYASLEYLDEQKLLGASSDPEKTYIEEVMPAKLELNLKYIEDRSLLVDIGLIFKTIFGIFR